MKGIKGMQKRFLKIKAQNVPLRARFIAALNLLLNNTFESNQKFEDKAVE